MLLPETIFVASVEETLPFALTTTFGATKSKTAVPSKLPFTVNALLPAVAVFNWSKRPSTISGVPTTNDARFALMMLPPLCVIPFGFAKT